MQQLSAFLFVLSVEIMASRKLYPEKITELSQVSEKVHLIRTWSRNFNLFAM
jgi:hypothetical protein